MDPKMPDIKSDVNKVDDGKKKASGLLGTLFGSGGSGTLGGLGGGIGAAGTGGLLATKAGIIALAVMGSAVAGGIGLAGYKMFGPGEADKVGGNLSLFAPKPAQTVDANALAPVNADGSSTSLDMMAQSAAKDKAADAAASASADVAPSDTTADDPGREAAAAAAAQREAEAKAQAAGAINSGGGAGALGSMGKGLANVKKLGALSGASGGGASTTAGSGAGGRPGDNLANAARSGGTSAFSKGGPGAKTNSFGRSALGKGGRGVNAQLKSVLGDHQRGNTQSSFAAGKTYDGGATQGGSAIGPEGGLIGMDGVGSGDGATNKSTPSNQIQQQKEIEPPTPKPKKSYSPWSKALERAQMLMLMAAALAFAASKLPPGPWAQYGRMIIGGLIMVIAGHICQIAGQITAGEHSQKTLASLVYLTGVGALVMGGKVMASFNNSPEADATANAGRFPEPMILGGGLMVVGLIGTMFNKPKQIELKPGEDPPDVRYEQRVNPVRYMV
jgi:hypothetical protein